jgi:hypothetical protein
MGPGAQTNDLGEFRLHSLPAGEYFIQVAPPLNRAGAPPSGSSEQALALVPTYFPGTTDWQAAQPIDLAAGQTAGDFTVVMVQVPAYRVSGIVRDESGEPFPNVRVRLVAEGSDASSTAVANALNQARTDEKGAFALPSVISGSYRLLAVPPALVDNVPDMFRGTNSGFVMSGGGGAAGGMVTTESRDGIVVQYRDDAGTTVPVVVNDRDVGDLEIAVGRPARR